MEAANSGTNFGSARRDLNVLIGVKGNVGMPDSVFDADTGEQFTNVLDVDFQVSRSGCVTTLVLRGGAIMPMSEEGIEG
jgi:hypothetical protein